MREQSLTSIFKKSPFPNKGKESEKKTEIYLTERTCALGGQSYKWSSPNNKGVPDRICIFPGPVHVFVEVKSEGETLSKVQSLVHRDLKLLTRHVYTVDTKVEVDNLLYVLRKEGTI